MQVAAQASAAVYSSEATPFFFDAQYAHAKRLISMPLSSFHRLARELADERKKELADERKLADAQAPRRPKQKVCLRPHTLVA